jgi:hypothetical protein
MPDEFPVYFDEVYHTEVTPHRNGPAEFLLRTQPTNLYACGGRIARSGVLATLEVPDFNVILEKALGIKKEEIVITETKKGGDIKK